MASYAENVSIGWRHHVFVMVRCRPNLKTPFRITSMTLGWGLLMLRSSISLLRKFLVLQKYMICSLNHLFDGCHRNTCQKRNSVRFDVMISVAWIFTPHPLPCGYKQILRRHEHGGCFCKFYATKMLTFKMQPNKMYSLDPLSYITHYVNNSVFL